MGIGTSPHLLPSSESRAKEVKVGSETKEGGGPGGPTTPRVRGFRLSRFGPDSTPIPDIGHSSVDDLTRELKLVVSNKDPVVFSLGPPLFLDDRRDKGTLFFLYVLSYSFSTTDPLRPQRVVSEDLSL